MHREYELAFGCVVKLFQRVFRSSLHFDAVMGYSEAAQWNGPQGIEGFRGSKYLNNVHKRTRYLKTRPRVAVSKRLQFSKNYRYALYGQGASNYKMGN
ncbi:unnamed protein product [Phytophthora fragariaefolia]|uniref:Unnamed protein product n=1 Tax=Phytophthora fragariaefolia TaxID=1490495 RepID=A0A9W6XM19_9STRA|nr:unnamed protein product [Phytophthora fragariaefolia]